MSESVEWILIRKWRQEPIGAVGLINGKVAIVTSFFDDRDGNKDGKVSFTERMAAMLSPISLEGSAVVEVAMQARVEFDVIERDPEFAQEAIRMWLHFAKGAILDGIYAVYFARGVKMTAGGVAKTITKNTVKEFAIRKGFEKVVKDAFMAAVDR